MTVSSADIEEQNDEILALSGILETSAFSHSESKGGGHSGVMHVEARIPGDGSIEILAGPKRENFSIRFLPPISSLFFCLRERRVGFFFLPILFARQGF